MAVLTPIPRTPQTTTIINTSGSSRSAKNTRKKSIRKTPRSPSLTPAELVEQARLEAIAEAELVQERERNAFQLKHSWESIFEKYGRDFDGIADEIDIFTGEVCVDNGHLRAMANASDKDSDDDGISWSKLISPEKENRRRKSKRKWNEQDDGREKVGGVKKTRMEKKVCGDCRPTCHGICPQCGTKGLDGPPLGAVTDDPVEETLSHPDLLSVEITHSSKLPSDDFMLAQLGPYGPAVLKALQNSGAKINIQRSPPMSKPMSSPLAQSQSTNLLSSSPPPIIPIASPLQARTNAPSNEHQVNTTPNPVSNTTSNAVPNTAPPKLDLRRKKPMPIVIPGDEVDELSAPNTPTIVSSSPFSKLSPKFKAKAALAADPIRKSTRKGKARLATIINADESEDELSSTSANTPTISCTPTPLASERSSFSSPSFQRPITMSSQTPRPKLTAEPKSTPRRRAPTLSSVWAPLADDPFYDPVWHDEHPDGTPQAFPTHPINPIFSTPRIVESPVIRALKREAAFSSSSRRRRDNISVTPSSRRKEKEPEAPGWTSTPVRSNFGFLDYLAEKEEPRESSSIVVEVGSNLSPQRDEEPHGANSLSKNYHSVPAATTSPPPPAKTSTPSASPPNKRVTRSSPPADDSELKILGVVRKNGVCGEKGFRCDRFCFKCISASELPV